MAKVDENSVLYWWRWRIHGGRCWYRSSYRCPQDKVDIPPRRTLETPYTAVRLHSASFLRPVRSLLPPGGARSQWQVSKIYIKMVLNLLCLKLFCLTQLERLYFGFKKSHLNIHWPFSSPRCAWGTSWGLHASVHSWPSPPSFVWSQTVPCWPPDPPASPRPETDLKDHHISGHVIKS